MEELELVTEWSSLRVSDVLVEKACQRCGAERHRYLAIRRDSRTYVLPGGEVVSGPFLQVIPIPPCWSGSGYGVAPSTVAQRRVYRVVIPPVAESREVAKSRDLERVRGPGKPMVTPKYYLTPEDGRELAGR